MAKKVQKAKKAAPKKAAKPVKKANAAKAKPVKKTAKPAKKTAKPVKKAAAKKVVKKVAPKKATAKKASPKKAVKPVKKAAAKPAPKKPVKKAAKPAPKKAVKKVAKPVAKKAVAKPVKKVAAKPVKKAAPAKAVKPVAKAPVKKVVPSPVAKKSAPASSSKSTLSKVIEKGKEVVKSILNPKSSATESKDKASSAKPQHGTVVEKSNPSAAKNVAADKSTTTKQEEKNTGGKEDMRKDDKKGGERAVAKPVGTSEKKAPEKPDPNQKTRYSDSELQEFRELIMKKLDEAHRDYELLKDTLSHRDNNGTDDTSPTFKLLEDGSDVLSKEETAQLAARQQKFIQALENALIRIENKTYGICRATGKLISKERLRSVPHATLSIEAKMEQS